MTKAGLAISVVFSTIAGYFLAVNDWSEVSFLTLLLLAVGGYCMVGASNVYNQIIEKDLDAKMDRTKNRPVASGRVSPKTALAMAIALTILGIVILYIVNPKTAMFGAISIFLYTSVYTPLKPITPLSVFVGAIPGAIPFMLGWVAATGEFGIEAGMLFIIQFFWQFPHFWAIGWFLYDDYKKGGFSMLPTGQRDTKTALQIILYTVWLIIVSVFPAFGLTGRLFLTPVAAVIVLLCGIWMLYSAVQLYNKRSAKAARSLMLVSVSYISLIQIIFIADKFLR
nr:heme o synthase [uncultured Flavobacterium sp.]